MRRLAWIPTLVVAAAFLLVAVVGPRLFISGIRVPLGRTAAEAGLTRYENIIFSPPDQKITLRGWWLPADEPRGAIIVVHGGGSNRADKWAKVPELCRDLQARHFDVLAFDMRNHGESDASLDGIPTFGPAEAHDVIGAVNYIEHRAPGLAIGALGFSMGGNVVIYAAAHDKRIRAVVTNETYTDVASALPNAVSASSSLPVWLVTPMLWFAENLHGVPISQARAIDAVGSLAPGELFVIHNEADPIVPVGEAWFLSAGAPDAVEWITAEPDPSKTSVDVSPPWGTHTKSYALYPEEYLEKVTAFFESRFGSYPPAPSLEEKGSALIPLPFQGRG